MKIIIVLLVLLFCPVFILAIGVTAFGVFGLFAAAALCACGLIIGISKLAEMPILCKKVGIYGMVIFLIVVSPLHLMEIFYRIIPFSLYAIPVLIMLLKCLSPCLLLVYNCGGLGLKEQRTFGQAIKGVWGFSLLIVGMVALVAVQISDLYSAMLTAIGTIMIIVGFILLLRQKSSVTREEHMGISITTIGVIIDILIGAVRAVSPEYLSSIGIASNIPFIIMLIGLVLFLSPIWEKYSVNK